MASVGLMDVYMCSLSMHFGDPQTFPVFQPSRPAFWETGTSCEFSSHNLSEKLGKPQESSQILKPKLIVLIWESSCWVYRDHKNQAIILEEPPFALWCLRI